MPQESAQYKAGFEKIHPIHGATIPCAQVDIIMNGHTHAYERSKPIANFQARALTTCSVDVPAVCATRPTAHQQTRVRGRMQFGPSVNAKTLFRLPLRMRRRMSAARCTWSWGTRATLRGSRAPSSTPASPSRPPASVRRRRCRVGRWGEQARALHHRLRAWASILLSLSESALFPRPPFARYPTVPELYTQFPPV